jgi:hypothetical protein
MGPGVKPVILADDLLTLTEGQAYAMICGYANRGRGALVDNTIPAETGGVSAVPERGAAALDRLRV